MLSMFLSWPNGKTGRFPTRKNQYRQKSRVFLYRVTQLKDIENKVCFECVTSCWGLQWDRGLNSEEIILSRGSCLSPYLTSLLSTCMTLEVCMNTWSNYLRLSPPSTINICSPRSVSATNLLRWLASSICHNSSSVCLPSGSRFKRSVPENSTGSYDKTMVQCEPFLLLMFKLF